MTIRTEQIGALVKRVKTWNPVRDAIGQTIRYVDLGAVNNDTKEISTHQVIQAVEAPSRARQLVCEGDILVSTVRPNLNGVARVLKELDGSTASTGFCVLRANDRIDPDFLFQWVKSPTFVAAMIARASGQSYPAVSDRIIFESEIPLPPLDEQRRIAAILDQADALRRKRLEAMDRLRALKNSLFNILLQSVLNTDQTTLGALTAEFRYGTSEKSGDRGVFVLRIPNVVGDRIDLTNLKRVSLAQNESDRLILKSGDLLFVRTNGNADYVARCAVVSEALGKELSLRPRDFVFASYLIRARLIFGVVNPVYLQAYLSSSEGRKAALSRAKTSAGQFNINIEGLSALPIPLPDRAEQEKFSTLTSKIDSEIGRHLRHLSSLDALFAALKHRAFNGELTSHALERELAGAV